MNPNNICEVLFLLNCLNFNYYQSSLITGLYTLIGWEKQEAHK
jgi:hypothetical protein